MGQRILLLTQWFDPEPTFKGLVFARALVQKGFEVEVVTGFPNYPGGKLYPGYNIKLLQKEIIDGVQVTRVPLYPSHDGSALKRVLNYLSFALAALIYCLFFLKRPKAIYAYHPPLTIGCVAVIIKFFRGAPVVYDIQDMWPDTLRATGMISNDKIISFIDKVARIVYKLVDQIVVLSPGFKEILIRRGVPATKIEVIPNWCDEASLASSSEMSLPQFQKDKFNVLFAGNMGKAQALSSILNAAELVQKQTHNINFIFLGGGLEVENLKSIALEKKLKNVVFLPPVPMAVVGNFLRHADALLVHLRKDPLFEITIPSKTQAYLAIGKPIVMGVGGDAASIINQAECGVVVEAENSKEIADSVLVLSRKSKNELELMSQNAREYYQHNLSVKIGTEKFSKIFSSFT